MQYQDIINQKINHIQKTHNNLYKETDRIFKLPKTFFNEKAKFFIQIRDIAGLQTVQLIHIDKEYKTAVEGLGEFMQEHYLVYEAQ